MSADKRFSNRVGIRSSGYDFGGTVRIRIRILSLVAGSKVDSGGGGLSAISVVELLLWMS